MLLEHRNTQKYVFINQITNLYSETPIFRQLKINKNYFTANIMT